MNIWHRVFRPDSLTYTLARALSHGEHAVTVCVVDPEHGDRSPDGIEKRLRDTPCVNIVPSDETAFPTVIDRLIVQVYPRPTESIRRVGSMAARAREITLITAGDRSRTWPSAIRLQWLEAMRFGSQLRKVDRILYKDGCYPLDLLRFVAPRKTTGFDVHSQFLHDPELFHGVHTQDWDPDVTRPILVNFLGSQDPGSRKCILDAVRPLFHSARPSSSPGSAKKAFFWHEYTDASPAGLAPDEFVRMLSRSDFTLCPRGYSLTTHRPIEALLRGSIPILSSSELDLYGIDLNRENCIAVGDGQWPDTIRRIADMDDGDIIQMRRKVWAMFEGNLCYDAIAKRIRRGLGVGA